MRFSRCNLAVGAAAILLCAFVLANTAGSQAQEPEGNFGVGIPDVFLPKYLNYRARQLNSSTPDVMRIRLGYVKGLSTIVHRNGGGGGRQSPVWRIQRQPERADAAPDLHRVARRPGGERPACLPDTVFGLVTFLASGTIEPS